MALDSHGLLAAALSLRVTADTTGLEAQLASKLTAAERRATLTADRVSASAGKVATAGVASSSKLEVATLRQTAAQESYNRLLRAGETDTVRLNRAQASLITSQRTVANEQIRLAEQSRLASRSGISPLGLVGGIAGLAALTTASRTLRTGVRELSDYQAGLAQAEAGIKSTGGSANVTADEIERLAQKIQAYSGYTDDAVVASEDLLLTFPRVRNEAGKNNDMFTRATVAAADLARRGFGDLSTNAKALGKALSDPVAGLTALRRSGITFTDSQKETIKRLVESNRLLDAQRVVLDEVNREVGGSAKAYGETLPGQLDKAHRSFEDLSQGIVTDVEPALRAAADAAEFLGKHKGLTEFGLSALGLGAGLLVVTKAVKSYRDVADTLFTRTPAKVAANQAVAASYEEVAVAAGAAARAETAAAVAGPGVLGEMAGLRATVPGAARIGIPAAGALALGGPVTAIGALALVAASAPSQGELHRTQDGVLRTKDGKPALMGRFGSGGQDYSRQRNLDLINDPGSFHPDPIVAARQRQQEQVQAQITQQARRAFTAGGAQYAAGVDIFSRAPSLIPRADPQAAQALGSAQAGAADAARRVTLDQQKLNALRATGKASTLQLAAAEETLRLAKERSAKASQGVTDAEKKATAERLPTARSLLRTATSQAERSRLDARAVERLYAVGVGGNLVARIVAQNANQPGALESVAKSMTPQLARALDRQFRQTKINGSIIAGSPDDWRKAGQNRALDFMAGVEATFNNASPAVVRARVRGVNRKNDLQEPVITPHPRSRPRQRALSGTPALPHGA